MRQRASSIVASRERLGGELVRIGLEVQPSAGNFLLVRAGDGAASWLLRRGLVVRTFPSGSPLVMSVGTSAQDRKPKAHKRRTPGLEFSFPGKVGLPLLSLYSLYSQVGHCIQQIVSMPMWVGEAELVWTK